MNANALNRLLGDVRLAVAIFGILSLCACAKNRPPRAERLHVTIDGMHCESCAEGITAALSEMRGVLKTNVHFSNSVQTVEYDANRLKPDQLVTVIADLGYTAKPATDNAR